MTNINIGNKIRELRKKKGITQEALASVLSVSKVRQVFLHFFDVLTAFGLHI